MPRWYTVLNLSTGKCCISVISSLANIYSTYHEHIVIICVFRKPIPGSCALKNLLMSFYSNFLPWSVTGSVRGRFLFVTQLQSHHQQNTVLKMFLTLVKVGGSAPLMLNLLAWEVAKLCAHIAHDIMSQGYLGRVKLSKHSTCNFMTVSVLSARISYLFVP